MSGTNPHEGHRQRLLERLRAEGPDNFAPHELLEALLFFSIPRINTNNLAHSLIEHFGSIGGVLGTERSELLKVKGIGPKTADLIMLVGSINRHTALASNDVKIRYNTLKKICNFLGNLYCNINIERICVLMFDAGMKLLDYNFVADGSISSAIALKSVIARRALIRNAAFVVIAHNHPDGLPLPSRDDIESTEHLRTAFETVEITMLEHIIVADKVCTPIMKMYNIKPNKSKGITVRAAISKNFYDGFDIPMLPVTDAPFNRDDGLDKL